MCLFTINVAVEKKINFNLSLLLIKIFSEHYYKKC